MQIKEPDSLLRPGCIFAIWLENQTKNGWLVARQVPWYRGGGVEYIIQNSEEISPTLFSAAKALKMQRMYNNTGYTAEMYTLAKID